MSKRIPSERTAASCGHSVTVKMTPDPDLNIELMEEASRLLCPKCRKEAK